ncbi:MAG: hypothetical protein IPP90_08000 [Gemmatimonadaceae bacterium]|nr:hypothetical protein [Gemmatimonadaceae bacterium]
MTSLRTRPDIIRLCGEQATGVWTVRVQCAEAWDSVRVELVPDTRVCEVKQAAMAVLVPDVHDAGGFVVKLRGHEVLDENSSVQAAGALDGSTLLITSRRRRPVR